MKVDFFEYDFSEQQLFALTPYQPFMFLSEDGIEGIVLNFHPDFFCISKHHEEVACNGILFNNIFSPPFIKVHTASVPVFDMLLDLDKDMTGIFSQQWLGRQMGLNASPWGLSLL